MQLLVSVTDAVEARIALDGGADIVDVKNPAEGALGAPTPTVLRSIRAAVGTAKPLSVAVGDMPNLPGTAALAAVGAAQLGADFVKVGLWGTSSEADAVVLLRAVRAALGSDTALIAGAYADAARVPGRPLPAQRLPSTARAAGADGCLLDTAIKDGRGLMEWLSPATLADLVAESHAYGLPIALAGSLRFEDFAAVRATDADIAGVRSAACREGRRSARLDVDRVRRLRIASKTRPTSPGRVPAAPHPLLRRAE